jgi:hypothetical protein
VVNGHYCATVQCATVIKKLSLSRAQAKELVKKLSIVPFTRCHGDDGDMDQGRLGRMYVSREGDMSW